MYEKNNDSGVENTNLVKYILLFVILSAVIISVSYLVELKGGYIEVLIKSSFILFIPSLSIIFKFVQDNKRVPSKLEKRKLIWYSILIIWLIASLVVLVEILYYDITLKTYFLDRVNEADSSTTFLVMVNIITIIFMSFSMYIFYNFCYGWFGKLFLKK